MIRRATDEDMAFVRSSWLRSYSSSEWAAYVTPRSELQPQACGHRVLKTRRANGLTTYAAGAIYWSTQRAVIERLTSHCNVSVFVADEPMVDGWICRDWKEPLIHFVYCRHSARGAGVARALLDDLASMPALEYTHLSRGLDTSKLPAGWVFNKAKAFR